MFQFKLIFNKIVDFFISGDVLPYTGSAEGILVASCHPRNFAHQTNVGLFMKNFVSTTTALCVLALSLATLTGCVGVITTTPIDFDSHKATTGAPVKAEVPGAEMEQQYFYYSTSTNGMACTPKQLYPQITRKVETKWMSVGYDPGWLETHVITKPDFVLISNEDGTLRSVTLSYEDTDFIKDAAELAKNLAELVNKLQQPQDSALSGADASTQACNANPVPFWICPIDGDDECSDKAYKSFQNHANKGSTQNQVQGGG